MATTNGNTRRSGISVSTSTRSLEEREKSGYSEGPVLYSERNSGVRRAVRADGQTAFTGANIGRRCAGGLPWNVQEKALMCNHVLTETAIATQ